MEIKSGQLTLFATKEDFEKAFEDGDIVAQTWAWIGDYDTIYPFWQVQYSEIRDGVRCYFCHAVPYGSHPCEYHWFEKKDITSTGLKWNKIPTQEELDEWCRNQYKDGQSLYVKQLNNHAKDDHWYPSYSEEQELADMLKTIGIDYRSVTRDNFDEKMKMLKVKK
jgi:hypothetical protein